MSEHTPGPWEWEPKAKYDQWDNQGPNLRSVAMGKAWDEYWGPDGSGMGKRREDMPPIPDVISAWGHDAWGINVSDADARLIAAAPDMADALDFIISLAEEEYEHCKVGTGAEVALRHIIRKSREAIAKATGQGSGA